MKRTLFLAAVATAVAGQVQARDYISIVGSSTVYPFATVVAERFGKTTDFKTPKIESTGSGGGLKLFCAGVGIEHPDVTNASRRIKQGEMEKCAGNGVNDILEVKIGYDGLPGSETPEVRRRSSVSSAPRAGVASGRTRHERLGGRVRRGRCAGRNGLREGVPESLPGPGVAALACCLPDLPFCRNACKKRAGSAECARYSNTRLNPGYSDPP